jgi:hypothetical protein
MTQISKWSLLRGLGPDDTVAVDMPRGARLLVAREQGADLCVWAEVDLSEPTEPVRFRIAGTDRSLPPMERRRHIGTGVLLGLALHVFVLGDAA